MLSSSPMLPFFFFERDRILSCGLLLDLSSFSPFVVFFSVLLLRPGFSRFLLLFASRLSPRFAVIFWICNYLPPPCKTPFYSELAVWKTPFSSSPPCIHNPSSFPPCSSLSPIIFPFFSRKAFRPQGDLLSLLIGPPRRITFGNSRVPPQTKSPVARRPDRQYGAPGMFALPSSFLYSLL